MCTFKILTGTHTTAGGRFTASCLFLSLEDTIFLPRIWSESQSFQHNISQHLELGGYMSTMDYITHKSL